MFVIRVADKERYFKGGSKDSQGKHRPIGWQAWECVDVQIQKLEKQFSVRIMTNEEVFTVLGELSNVKRCIAELTDMANEKEVMIPLSPMQIRALLAHDHSYRRSIENSCRVFMTLKEAEVTIRGGQNAVKSAERAVNDLMKSTEMSLGRADA